MKQIITLTFISMVSSGLVISSTQAADEEKVYASRLS
jgi:hypothetical protein